MAQNKKFKFIKKKKNYYVQEKEYKVLITEQKTKIKEL